jgi:hypothetical protein
MMPEEWGHAHMQHKLFYGPHLYDTVSIFKWYDNILVVVATTQFSCSSNDQITRFQADEGPENPNMAKN